MNCLLRDRTASINRLLTSPRVAIQLRTAHSTPRVIMASQQKIDPKKQQGMIRTLSG